MRFKSERIRTEMVYSAHVWDGLLLDNWNLCDNLIVAVLNNSGSATALGGSLLLLGS